MDLKTTADEQYGLVTATQARAAGMDRDQIRGKVRYGMWTRTLRGIYLLDPSRSCEPADEVRREVMASVLYSGGVASHQSAALVHGISDVRPPVAHVKCLRDLRSSEIRIHRTDPGATTTRARLPVTTIPQTILDLAGLLSEAEVSRIVDEVLLNRLSTSGAFIDLLAASRLTKASALLRLILGDRAFGIPESELERRMLKFFRGTNLPRPQLGVSVGRYRLDAYWQRGMVGLEMDGFLYHRNSDQLKCDHEREMWLAGRGVQLVRIGWSALRLEPKECEQSLAKVLTCRGTLFPDLLTT